MTDASQAEGLQPEVEVEVATPATQTAPQSSASETGPPAGDAGRAAEQQPAAPPPEERISAITRRLQEEQRRREDLEGQLARYQQSLQATQQTAVATGRAAVEARISDAERRFKTAYESGDADGMIRAQHDLASGQLDLRQLGAYEQQIRQPPQPTPPPQRPTVSAQAQDWAGRNTWFGRNAGATAYAYGVDAELKAEGYAADSDAYYAELDTRIARRFPELGTPAPRQGQQRSTPIVASAARTPTGSRKVTLTASQVETARALGLTPERYAAEMLRLEATR